MEWGIVPGQSILLDELLEATDVHLAQAKGMGLIGGIAVIDAASQGPRLPGVATPRRILPGAGISLVQRTDRWRRLCQEQGRFRCGDEQGVIVFGEPAATAAQATGGPERGHLPVERS